MNYEYLNHLYLNLIPRYHTYRLTPQTAKPENRSSCNNNTLLPVRHIAAFTLKLNVKQ